MRTPICDFVRRYADRGAVRLHMPGHKGRMPESEGIGALLDITEIRGADSLYEAEGIIAESERNASELFGCDTFYSTEGSSQCIRAMLFLACQKAREAGKEPLVLAGRNAHKTFISAAALVGFDVEWIYPAEDESYLSCSFDTDILDRVIAEKKPCAVYVTSPDYLGNMADVKVLSEACHKHGVMLLVDNAHGAYLRFLPVSRHPIDMGADMCCDSAHKTLPVLTGGAYLHIADKEISANAKNALSLFGSTSPSYLILQSLDKANVYLANAYKNELNDLCLKTKKMREKLTSVGYTLLGDEPTKLTVDSKKYGYKGTELADILRESNVECEFSDPDLLVLMMSPQNTDGELELLEKALLTIPKREEIKEKAPGFRCAERVLSIREAMLSPSETIPVSESMGRVLAAASVGCPPAVPITVCGERIDENSVRLFEYYGVEKCTVVKFMK